MMNYEEFYEYLKGPSPVFGELGFPDDRYYWNVETIEELDNAVIWRIEYFNIKTGAACSEVNL